MFARAAAAGLMSVGVDVIDVGDGADADGAARGRAPPRRGRTDPDREPQSDRVERAQVRRARRHLSGCRGRRPGARAGGARARRGRAGTAWATCGRIGEAVARHLDAILALPVIDVDRDPPARDSRSRWTACAVPGRSRCSRCSSGSAAGCSGINLEPDGRFPRAPEPVPENLGELGRLVRESGADIGLAVDPDVDRLALVDETGRRNRRGLHPGLRGPGSVAGPQQCGGTADRGREPFDQPGG